MLPDRRGLEALYIPVYIITIVIYQFVLQNKKTTSIYVKCQNYYCCRVQYFLRNCTKTFFFVCLHSSQVKSILHSGQTKKHITGNSSAKHNPSHGWLVNRQRPAMMSSTRGGWCNDTVVVCDNEIHRNGLMSLTSWPQPTAKTLQDLSNLWFSSQQSTRNTHTHTGTYCTYTYNVFTSKYSFECADIQRTNTTCLWGCLGLSCSRLSFPNIFLLSLRLNPRSQQPLGDNAPTLPASPIPISTRVSQLAARAWSKPADWRHKTEEGEGEGKTRTETDEGRRSRVFLLSCFSGWQKTNERRGLNGPVNPQTKA